MYATYHLVGFSEGLNAKNIWPVYTIYIFIFLTKCTREASQQNCRG